MMLSQQFRDACKKYGITTKQRLYAAGSEYLTFYDRDDEYLLKARISNHKPRTQPHSPADIHFSSRVSQQHIEEMLLKALGVPK